MAEEKDAYRDAGVDVEAASKTKKAIVDMVRSTFRPEVLTDIGSFGGLFSANFNTMREPILVSSVDGVGTKLKVAVLMNRHDTVGRDLVNHCVNDILAMGAEPLFFLDYLAYQRHNDTMVKEIMTGLTAACRENRCALIGGEMAELSDMYRPGEYDLAGTIVGLVEKDSILDGSAVEEGDVLVGLESSGLHTNGYTLARKILLEKEALSVNDTIKEIGRTVGEEFLEPHRSYLLPIKPFLCKPELHALAHITGGGFEGNISRILPDHVNARIITKSWTPFPIFRILKDKGGLSDRECYRTFNMGIGMVAIISPENVENFIEQINKTGLNTTVIGDVTPGDGTVKLVTT